MERKTDDTIDNATVVATPDEYTVVIDRGEQHSIMAGVRFAIYAIGEEIFDPDTKRLLGRLEIFKGIGIVVHVQDRMATLESDRFLPLRKKAENTLPADEGDMKPFDNPKVGDRAKPISQL